MSHLGPRIYLAIHLVSFAVSCVLGPLRGHDVAISALGGLALGPLNLLLLLLLPPRRRPGKCPACAAPLPPGAARCERCGRPASPLPPAAADPGR
jgi:hypothetical protein